MQALLTIDFQGDYFTECTACRESCEYVGNWLSMDITNEYERMPDIGDVYKRQGLSGHDGAVLLQNP